MKVSAQIRRFTIAIAIVSGISFTGVDTATAEAVAPPTLTLISGGQIIQDSSVLSTGDTLTAVAGGLLNPGSGSRELRIDLDPATIYQAGGVTAPEGWTIEWSTDDGASWVGTEPGIPGDVTSVRATATVVAGTVVQGSQRYSKTLNASAPASTFSGSTGGDGWDVFFYDDYVLNVFHHQSSYVALDCHLRSTGARCDGYNPEVNVSTGVTGSRFPGYQAANRSGGWVDGNTGYAYLFTTETATNTPGALCVDLNVSPPESCGFVALSTATNVTSYGQLSNAEGASGRLFGIESANQQLLCLNAATQAACAGSPVQLTGTTGSPSQYHHVYPLGSKVFASTNQNLYCFEAATLAACAGAWPVSYSSLTWTAQSMSPVAHMDASGVIDGVCMWNGCLDLAGADQTSGATPNWVNPHSITPWSASNTNTSSGYYGRFEASAGRAFLQRVLSSADIYCFDYATEAACAGFTEQVIDGSLYALRADPNNPTCIWYNSDPGKIGLFDAYTGATECTANPVITLQPSAFAPRFVCATSGGIDHWISFQLTALNGTNPVTTQTLTMRTGNGDAVAGWTNTPINVGQLIDLSALDIGDTGARPTFNVGFNLTSGTLTDADFEVIYEGRGPELCVDLTIDNTSAPGSLNCPVVIGLAATITENTGTVSTAAAPDRSIVASGSSIDCPENIIPATPPGAVLALSAASTSPGSSSGTIVFQPPADDGGSPVRWYEYSVNDGAWAVAPAVSDGSGGFTVPLTGLVIGTSYSIQVRAVNLLGNGAVAVISFTPAAAPTTTVATTTTTTPTTTVAPAILPTTGSEGTGASIALLLLVAGSFSLFVARRQRSV